MKLYPLPAEDSDFQSSKLWESQKNARAVRWYVLVVPGEYHRAGQELRKEQERRQRRGETPIDYFAPTYVEVRHEDSKFVNTQRPLLFNYVFIHASEQEIYRMKQSLPHYNFLPRVRSGGQEHYPYLSDKAMENLRWIARSYADVLPVYASVSDRLVRGDKVRITQGQFKGAEATVVIQPGPGERTIMVCIDNWMWVPLFQVQAGQYEVISLCKENRHVYTNLDNERIIGGLHQALRRHHSPQGVTADDVALAREALRLYAHLQMETDVMRSKLYSILLPAYTVLQEKEESGKLVAFVRSILPAIKAEQSRALLWTILYGCTGNSIYHEQAHRIIDSWRVEPCPKKSKLQLLRWLDDFDAWCGHL